MGLLWTLALLLSGLVVGVSGAKPEHIENLRVLAESSEFSRQNERTRHAAYCGIERLQVLGPQAQEHDVMSLAILGCMDRIPERMCRSSAAEMWSSRNMTADFKSSSNFCEVLRAFMLAPSLEAAGRRRFWTRRRHRRRRVPTTKYIFGKNYHALECDPAEGTTITTEAECIDAVLTMRKDLNNEYINYGANPGRKFAARGCFTWDKKTFRLNTWGKDEWYKFGNAWKRLENYGSWPVCRNKYR